MSGAGQGDDVPFVGRVSELARLTDAVERARGGEPSAWFVAGDAGVGKTRLLGEVGRRAADMGVPVVTGRCGDLGGGLPYLPFAEVVGALAGGGAVDDVIASRPALASLTGERPPGQVPRSESDGDRRLPLFDAVLALLAAASDRAGELVVVLEDLHWADRSSRELLQFVLARLGGERLVLVGSYRSDDLHRRHPLRQALTELVRLPGVERLDLVPFDAADLALFLAGVTGTPVDDETVATVLERSEGNAYFAQEIITCGASASAGLPSGLVDVLLGRVERLGAPAQLLVRTASVAGRCVSDALLVGVTDLQGGEVEAALRDAVAHLVLVADAAGDGPGYSFRHALLREAVYADLLPGERVRLHAAYAAVLSRPDHVSARGGAAEAAHHSLLAHDLPRALAMSVRAADEAAGMRAPAEASAHLEQALTLWSAVPDAAEITGTDRVRLGLAAARAAADAGDPGRAVALATEARDLSRGTGPIDVELAALAERRLAEHLYAVDRDADSRAAAQRALDLVVDLPGTEVQVRAAAMHARAAAGVSHGVDMAGTAASLRGAEAALAGARALGLRDVEGDVLATLAWLDQAAGSTADAVRRLEAAGDLARAGGHHGTELRAEYDLAALRYYAGDVAEALHLLPSVLATADAHGLTWSVYGLEARVLRVIAEYVAGRWPESQQAAQLAGRRPPDAVAARLAAAELYVLVGRGDPAAAERVAHLKGSWHHDGQIALVAGGCEADLHQWQGDYPAATDAALRAIDHVTGTWGEWYLGGIWLAALALSAQADRAAAARLRGDAGTVSDAHAVGHGLVEGARASAARGRPRAGRPGPEAVAWLARAEAEWSRLTGETGDAATGPWEQALAAFGYGYPYEQARSTWRLAEALVDVGCRDAAAAHAGAAHETAAELGAVPLARAVRALVRRARLAVDVEPVAGAESVRAAVADLLTPREKAVLALLADGLTNGQIGRSLFISTKTASVHVSHLMAKLGAASRTEAVALSYQRGLLGAAPPRADAP